MVRIDELTTVRRIIRETAKTIVMYIPMMLKKVYS
jgi:hypothetical protein